MAINPNILFQGRVPDVGASINNALLNVGNIQKIQQAREDAPLRQRLLEAQTQTAEQGVELAGQQQEVISSLGVIAELDPIIAAGDTQLGINTLDAALNAGRIDQDDFRVLAQSLQNPEVFGQLKNAASEQARVLGVGGNVSTGFQEFERTATAAGLEPGSPEYIQAAKAKLGITKKAGVESAPQIVDVGGVPHIFDKNQQKLIPAEVAGKEVTAESVGESKATIEEARKFGELTGSSRAKAIDTAVDQISKIQTNIANLDEAYSALEKGANSGPIIAKWTPTLKAQTQRLENVRNKLGLDVIGAVTFGALSKGEMDLALATALPNLPTEELKLWIKSRQDAQRKLINYYDKQIDHLDDGGTVSSFRRIMKRQSSQGGTPDASGQTTGNQRERYNPQTGSLEGNTIRSRIDELNKKLGR